MDKADVTPEKRGDTYCVRPSDGNDVSHSLCDEKFACWAGEILEIDVDIFFASLRDCDFATLDRFFFLCSLRDFAPDAKSNA